MHWKLISLAFLAEACLFAQAPAPATTTYRGRVIDVATLQGLPGATVDLRPAFDPTNLLYLQQRQTYSVKSDEKGEFAIEAAEGDFALYVTLEGYAQEDPYSRPVSLKNGRPAPPPATIRMVRGATVSGVVEDAGEKPVQGISVELIDSLSAARGVGLRQTTGPDGRFTIQSVAPGSYVLRGTVGQRIALAPGQTRADLPAPEFAPTYYPSSLDGAGAAAIQIYSGIDVPNLRLRLRKVEFYSVSGRVVGRESNTTPATSVRLRRVEDSRISIPTSIAELPIQAPIVADGTFRIDRVMPGSYIAIIQTDISRIVFPLGSEQVIVTNRDVEDLRLTVQPGGILAGKLVFEDGTFHAGNWPMVLEGRTAAGEVGTPVTFSNTGEFSVEGIASGTYRLNFSNRATIAVNKVEVGGRTFEGSKFEFAVPGSDRVVITATETGATIQGTLEGMRAPGEAVSGVASAALVSGFTDRLSVVRTAPLAEDGTFSLKTLEPGRYLVCAWRDPGPAVLNLLQSANAPVQRLGQQCKTVALKTNESGQVQVRQTSVADVTR